MSKVHYKAVRPDGKDFFSGTIDYAAALGGKVKAPSAASKNGYSCCSNGVLHASVVPTETLIGGSWPCRLFEVTGRPVAEEGHKRGFRSLTVVREIDATLALGPQGKEVAALIERATRLSVTEARSLRAALAAALAAAWDAALAAAWGAAWGAGGGAGGLLIRDLIGTAVTQDQYDLLTRPWREAIGPLHPEDAAL